jgi:hypothetical protein
MLIVGLHWVQQQSPQRPPGPISLLDKLEAGRHQVSSSTSAVVTYCSFLPHKNNQRDTAAVVLLRKVVDHSLGHIYKVCGVVVVGDAPQAGRGCGCH